MDQLTRKALLCCGLLVCAVLLSAASSPSEREQQLQATADALSARLAVPDGSVQGAAVTSESSVQSVRTPTASPRPKIEATAVAPVVISATEVQNPIPREIDRVELVTDLVHLADFRLDSSANVAYLTDTDYTLHIVDLAAAQEIFSTRVSGDRLLLDAPNQRLYIMPDWPWAREGVSPTVTVFDTAARKVVAELPGSRVGVDSVGGRLYLGDDVSFYSHDEPGVRLYAAATLELLRTGTLAGNPIYNAAADELIIQNSSAWTADPETLELRSDLYPQITGLEIPGCTGCPAAVDAFVFPEQQAVAVQTTILSTQGAGRKVPADLYDAATMERLPTIFQMGSSCSSQPMLRAPLDGLVLHAEGYARYVVYNNLLLEDETGRLLLGRDGLRDPFVNEATKVGYIQSSSLSGYVLDVGTLAPVGMIDSLCFFARDAASGLLFATDSARHALVILEPTGGESKLSPPQPFAFEDEYIVSIHASPDYADDQTLYLVVWLTDGSGGQALLRSTDGGKTYTRLGGLPVGEDLELTMAISPDFAHDKTLYAGGARSGFAGEGVWKSTDAGDTWTPEWDGLSHLRVNHLVLSPRYALDQTLLAYAPYERIAEWENGYSIHRSRDGGLSWTLVITAESEDQLPAPSVYLPITVTVDLPVRKDNWFEPIQVRIDNTSWTSATADLGNAEAARAVLQAPSGTPARDIFVVTEVGIYRTSDDGRTWVRWSDPRFTALEGEDGISAAAVTPLLGGEGYRLLIGTAYGALWVIDPETATWDAVVKEASSSAAPDTPEAATPKSEEAPGAAVTTTPVVALPAQESAPPTAATAAAGSDVATLGAPPAGLYRPTGIFGPQWEGDGALQESMGYARSEQPNSVAAAYQYFEHGVMLWRSDTRQIYAIYDGGAWDVFDDTFVEGAAESDPALIAPSGLMQPVRGFGKLWRSDETVRERLGWAIGKEAAINALIQDFEHGTYVRADAIEAALIERPASREWVK